MSAGSILTDLLQSPSLFRIITYPFLKDLGELFLLLLQAVTWTLTKQYGRKRECPTRFENSQIQPYEM